MYILQTKHVTKNIKNNYQDIEKELNILFQVISHPGYTNRKQELVVEEWKKLLSDN